MKDYLNPPTTKIKNNEPHVKLFLRSNLGWLWGYPVELKAQNIIWQQLYLPSPWNNALLTISTETLAKAGHAYNQAFNTFPKVLPKVVGDTAQWKHQTQLKLQAIRSLLNGQSVDVWQVLFIPNQRTSAFTHQAARIKHSSPILTTIIDQFTWWLSLDVAILEEAIHWLEQQQSYLVKLYELAPEQASQNIMCLFALSRESSAGKMNGLFDILTHQVWEPYGVLHYWQFFEDTRGFFEGFQKAESWAFIKTHHLQSKRIYSWSTWLQTLMTLAPKLRRRHIEIALVLYQPAILNSWSQWCREADEFIALYHRMTQDYIFTTQYQKLDSLDKQRHYDFELKRNTQHLYYHWKTVSNRTPLHIQKQLITPLSIISHYAATPKAMQIVTVLAVVLTKVPPHSTWSQPDSLHLLLTHWWTLRSILAPAAYARYDSVLQYWLDYLQGANTSEGLALRLVPWEVVASHDYVHSLQQWPSQTIEFDIIYNNQLPNHAKQFFKDLAQVGEASLVYPDFDRRFSTFYQEAPSTWPKLEFFLAVVEHYDSVPDIDSENIQFISLLLTDPTDIKQFIQLYGRWHSRYCYSESPFTSIAAAYHLFEQGHQSLIILLEHYQLWDLLLPLASIMDVFQQVKSTPPAIRIFERDWLEE